jgi:hypothetical protein
VSLPAGGTPFRGELLPPVGIEEWVPFSEGEGPWQMAGGGAARLGRAGASRAAAGRLHAAQAAPREGLNGIL